MITGMHAIIHRRNAEADRAFLRDVIGWSSVAAGGGWPIFAAPPAEVAVHPSRGGGSHEVFLMCDDIEAQVALLNSRGVQCSPIAEQPWGRLTTMTLPGGGDLEVYQPLHPLAHGPTT